MRLFCAALLVSMVGCATSSGVLKTGTNTYVVTTSASPGAGGMAAAKKSAYDQANQECTKQGLSINTTEDHSTAPSWTDGMYVVNLTFRCEKK